MIFLTSGLSIPIPNATVATIHWEIRSKDKNNSPENIFE